MKKIGIFYGSTTGNTSDAAKKIQEEFGEDIAQVFDVSNVSISDVEKFDNLIFGASTWGGGDIQDDFDSFINDISNIDLSNKRIAIFGLGDQDSHDDTFVNAMGEVYSKFSNATIVGFTSTDGYDYEESTAVKDGKFVGLALDEDNQSELTESRIKNWVEDLKKSFV